MSQWFYAEGNRQQRGPLASEELVALYQSSRIAADTLVWRDGMAQWQPLREVADQIGLVIAPPAAATAAPEADADSPVEAEVAAAAPDPVPAPVLPPQIPVHTPPSPAAAVHAAVPPRQGLSGCAIAAIIGAAAGVVLLAILGVLAAIAMPAYNQYTLRAKTSTAVASLAVLKTQVAAFADAHGQCPVNDDEGFGSAESYAGNGLAAVRIGRFDNHHCGIEAELSAPGEAKLDGKLLWLDYDSEQQQWECTAEPDDTYLPLECRG